MSVNTTNPSTYFGGTWEQVAVEKYLIGYNAYNQWFDKPGQSKGSGAGPGSWNTNDHILTVDEIPSHNHLDRIPHTSNAAHNTNGDYLPYGGWNANANSVSYYIETSKTGGGKGHSHFQVSPYYAVVVWKRTA